LDLLRRDDGVVAVIFAVMAIPFIAMAGWAVDYVRLQHVKDFLQAEVDNAALAAVHEGMDLDTVRRAGLEQIGLEYNGSWADAVEMTVTRSVNRTQATATAQVPLAFMKIIPGIPDQQTVSVLAIAEFTETAPEYSVPEYTYLDQNAGDFNRLWLYCFWPERVGLNDSNRPERTQMVPMSDNGEKISYTLVSTVEGASVPYDRMLAEEKARIERNKQYGLDGQLNGLHRKNSSNSNQRFWVMPVCEQGSFLSIRLENVIGARTNRAVWDEGGSRNNYYTDTNLDNPENPHSGLYASNGRPLNIMETILCRDLDECTTTNRGGIIPNNIPDRDPQNAGLNCPENQYMYYGWEDRPPVDGNWSDRDYNDIQIIMKCPRMVAVGERYSRLIF
jgi:hypothetical protein